MIRALNFGSSGLASSLGKILNYHNVTPLPGVKMGTGEFNAGVNPAVDSHPIQWE